MPRFRLKNYLLLGAIAGVVNQMRPPQVSDFGGGGLDSPIYVNGATGEVFIYINGVIVPINSLNVYAAGARGNGTADDAPAINAILASAPVGAIVVMPLPQPGAFFRCASGITIPAGVSLVGLSYCADAGNTGFLGVELRFDLSVATCVTLTGGASAASGALRNVTINRAAGAVPAGSIGVLFTNSVSPLCEDVHVFRSEIAFKAKTCVAVNLVRVVTTKITGTHYWFEDTVQVRMLQCGAGKNGGLDVNCNDYVRIKGSTDTVWATQCQFNLSANACTNAIYFDGAPSANGIYSFDACHFELISHLVGQTGAGSATRLSFINCTVNVIGGTGEVFNVPAAFLPYLTMVGCPFVLGTTTFNGFTSLAISSNRFLFNVVLAAGSSGVFAGNHCENDLAITGAQIGLTVNNNSFPVTGSITDTGAGLYAVGTANVINNSGPGRSVISKQQGATGLGRYTFAQIGTPADGTMLYVTDGTAASNPLVGGGTGCFAIRQNGAWKGL